MKQRATTRLEVPGPQRGCELDTRENCKSYKDHKRSKVAGQQRLFSTTSFENEFMLYQTQYRMLQSRIEQSHVREAYEVISSQDKEMSLSRTQPQKKHRKKAEKNPIVLASEMFGESAIGGTMQQSGREKSLSSMAMRKRGLAKVDEFTGSEAVTLKKLLKTLRTKTWDPSLYFLIRFFSIRHKLQPMSLESKALVRQRWCYLIRMLSVFAKIESVLSERACEKCSSCITCFDMITASKKPMYWGPKKNFLFDKDAYKVHANTMLSMDAQNTLCKVDPDERTPEQISQVVLSLQYVDAFAKLSTTIQHRLVEEAYYLRLGTGRVVLRQGHIPQNFYFVLLGQALSKRFLASGKTETIAILKKGDSFGSVAIFNGCRRLATVISRTPLHLLVIPKNVFISQFIKNVWDPYADTIMFLSKLWFMQSWPMFHLTKCPHQCHMKQFRRTEIIEADAAASKWIYVIKTGVCRVYQKLNIKLSQKVSADEESELSSHKLDSQELDFRASSNVTSFLLKSKRFSVFMTGSLSQEGNKPKKSERRAKTPCLPPLGEHTVGDSSDEVYSSNCLLEHLSAGFTNCRAQERAECDYKLVQTLRYLDVFGLEDLQLDRKCPPPRRHLLLISDDAECVMLSKSFYLRMACPDLRERVIAKLTARKTTYSQVTVEDCSLIVKGGIVKDPQAILDPLQPAFCIHC